MSTLCYRTCRIINTAWLLCLPGMALAQSENIPFHKEPYFVDSGLHDGLTGPGAETFAAFQALIQVPGSSWLRLQFLAFNLGALDAMGAEVNDSTMVVQDTIRSFITITSLEDGGRQILDAVSLQQWRKTSAYFNGAAVEIELHIAPGDQGIFFQISDLYVGERENALSLGKTLDLCGADDRFSSDYPMVGRILNIDAQGDTLMQCTGWITSNGAHLTAGHCVGQNCAGSDINILEFNVPPSENDGTINFAHPDDQYAIDQGSDDCAAGGPGNDWDVFACYANSNTGLLPVQAQQAFYRMTNPDWIEAPPIRITGYGADDSSYNYIQQTSTGPYVEEDSLGPSDVSHRYLVDTEDGTSGGPIINAGNALTIGINTHFDCKKLSYNSGTSFENNNLEAAIRDFPGPNVKYTDKDHPAVSEDGTIFQPFATVGQAVTAVPSGGIVSVVAGFNNETLTITTAMTLTAPVGVVTIGAAGPPKAIPPGTEVASSPDGAIPAVYSLSPAYPNPFNPATTLRFGLPENATVRLVVYDLRGREVARLLERHLEAGYHAVVWHGTTRAGVELPSGMYIARLTAARYSKSIKMLLLK